MFITKLSSFAKIPERQTIGSAGYDLYSIEDKIIHPHSQTIISTGIALDLPKNTCGKIYGRSGLSVKHQIEVGAGLIDEDYNGEIKVILYNFGNEEFKCQIGMRIAQIVIHPIETPKIIERSSPFKNKTEQHNGFGSTGSF